MATVKELRKEGRLDEALDLALTQYQADTENKYARSSLAWVYYDFCKRAANDSNLQDFEQYFNEIDQLGMLDDDLIKQNLPWTFLALTRLMRQDKKNDETFNRIFAMMQKLALEKPSKSYTLLMKAMLKMKDCNAFKEFCDWWDFSNFAPEDNDEEEIPNGRKVMSVAEQSYIAYSKNLIESKDIERTQKFLPHLEEVAQNYRRMQYPGYYYGKLLLLTGKGKEAFNALLPFARKKRTEFWIWQLIAETQSDDTVKRACLMRALNCRTQEKFLINVRKAYAAMLIEMKEYAVAKYHICKIIEVYREEGYHVPAYLHEWVNLPWFKQVAPTEKATSSIDYKTITDELLYGDVPSQMAVVVFVNKDKKIANVVYGKEKVGFFKYDRFMKKVKVGDLLTLRIDGGAKDEKLNVVSAMPCNDSVDNNYYAQFTATVSANRAKTFFSVKHGAEVVYLPMQLVKQNNISEGDNVKVVAAYDFNRKRREWGWRGLVVAQL